MVPKPADVGGIVCIVQSRGPRPRHFSGPQHKLLSPSHRIYPTGFLYNISAPSPSRRDRLGSRKLAIVASIGPLGWLVFRLARHFRLNVAFAQSIFSAMDPR